MKQWKLLSVIVVGAFAAMGTLYVTFVPKAEFIAHAEDYKNHKQSVRAEYLQKRIWALEDRLAKNPNDKDSQRKKQAFEKELAMVECQLYPETCK